MDIQLLLRLHLHFFIIAKSVEKTSDFIRFPKIFIPLHSLITSGTRKNDFLSVPSMDFGRCFIDKSLLNNFNILSLIIN